jgi:hypothetical protein
MSIDAQGPLSHPSRYSPLPAPLSAVTQRDYAAAARVGIQAVPARPQDPINATAKRERTPTTATDRRAVEDRDRLDALRWAALRRDAAAITGR